MARSSRTWSRQSHAICSPLQCCGSRRPVFRSCSTSTSSGLTDIDLDCPEAIALAPYILPATDAVFGRQSKPASHFLYTTALAGVVNKAAQRFKDPMPNAMMVELRIGGAKGAQTVFPG